jgi:hypothetical protein
MNSNVDPWTLLNNNVSNLSYPKNFFAPSLQLSLVTTSKVNCNSQTGNLFTSTLQSTASNPVTFTTLGTDSTLILQTTAAASPNATQNLNFGNLASTSLQHSNTGLLFTDPLGIQFGSAGAKMKLLYIDAFNLPNSGVNNFRFSKSIAVPAGYTLGSTNLLLISLDKTADSGFPDAFSLNTSNVVLTGSSLVGYTLTYDVTAYRIDSNAGWGSSTYSIHLYWINT